MRQPQFPVASKVYYKNQWIVTLVLAILLAAKIIQGAIAQPVEHQVIVHPADHREQPKPVEHIHPNVDEYVLYYRMELSDDRSKITLFDGDRVVDVFYRRYYQNKRLFEAVDADINRSIPTH